MAANMTALPVVNPGEYHQIPFDPSKTDIISFLCQPPSTNWSAMSDRADVDNFYTRLRVILDVYVVIALCLIGFVGNALAIAVLRRDQVINPWQRHYRDESFFSIAEQRCMNSSPSLQRILARALAT
jgi:hypothetical protein